MAHCSGRTIRVLCLSLIACALTHAQSLDALARDYRKNPSTQSRATLARFASSHAADETGALAHLALAAGDYERAEYESAIAELKDLDSRLPRLRDYIAYLRGAALYGAQNYGEAVRSLESVWSFSPATPVLPKAAITAAHAYVDARQPKDAVEILRRYIDKLPSPQAMFLLAQAAEASGDLIAAATHYESVYFWSPTAPEASQAEAALDRLRQQLGDNFPPAMPATMMARADRLMRGGDPRRAKTEFSAIATQVGGVDRDLARVRVGVADYFARRNQEAFDYLASLQVSDPEADAERQYYQLAAARRLEREEQARQIADQMGRDHPTSRWRREGLLSVANHFLVQNQPEVYEPYYRACVEAFPSDAQAPYCHWKLVWAEYLRRKPEAVAMLREHLTRFPASEKAAAALYFLGRLSEKAGDSASARAYYSEITARFPGFFHAVLATERLKTVRAAAPSPAVTQFLRGVAFPAKPQLPGFDTDPPTRARFDRARLLASAGLDDWADSELRFGAKTDAKPAATALELARLAEPRNEPDKGVRAIKAFAPGYLSLPLNAAPDEFWRFAFPMPFRNALQSAAAANSLDPYLVAALIRQESEFKVDVVSPANAYGLMQVLPGTGREIARKLGIRRFTRNMLFDGDTNIRIGAYYLRSMLDGFGGQVEPALASYNGGKTRVVQWLTFAKYEEPAEFIETIPFTETRNYVQIVLRNADMYRRLYASK